MEYRLTLLVLLQILAFQNYVSRFLTVVTQILLLMVRLYMPSKFIIVHVLNIATFSILLFWLGPLQEVKKTIFTKLSI